MTAPAADAMTAQRRPFADYRATHFRFEASADGKVATVTLNRPEKKNPLTFDSYAELRDLFRDLVLRERRQGRRSSPAPAATSAPAATCTRSSGR